MHQIGADEPRHVEHIGAIVYLVIRPRLIEFVVTDQNLDHDRQIALRKQISNFMSIIRGGALPKGVTINIPLKLDLRP